MQKLDRRDFLPLAMLLALALGNRIYRLGNASIWLDEAETVRIASLPLSTLWISANDPTPPLHYSVIHLLLYFGHSEFLLRLPSVLAGVATIAVIYLAARKVGSRAAASTAALLLTLSFHNIEYSQEARGYALLGLCIAVSFLGITTLYSRWNDRPTGFTFIEFLKSGGGLYAAGLIAALYSHNTAFFYWLAVQFFFIAWWHRPFAFAPSLLVAWFATNLAVLLAWTPWLLVSLELMSKGGLGWLGHYGPERAYHTWRAVHGMPGVPIGQPWIDAGLLILGLLGLYCLRRQAALAWLFAGLLVSSSLCIWAFGFLFSPVYMSRTILWGSLFSAVLIGVGIAALPRRIGQVLILLILLTGASGAWNYHQQNAGENENWRAVAAEVRKMQRDNDIFLFRTSYIARPFFYYIEDFSPGWDVIAWNCRQQTASFGKVERGDPLAQITWNRRDVSDPEPVPQRSEATLWVIVSHCSPEDRRRADTRLLSAWRVAQSYRFRGVRLYRMEPAESSRRDLRRNDSIPPALRELRERYKKH